MQQITMSRVELYQIKTGFTRVSNGLTEIIDDTRNLFQFKRTRHGCFNTDRLTIFIAQRSTCSRAKCGRRYRCLTARLQAGVRNASGVPQLYGHMTIFSMNASGNFSMRQFVPDYGCQVHQHTLLPGQKFAWLR